MNERKSKKIGIIIVFVAIILMIVLIYFTFVKNTQDLTDNINLESDTPTNLEEIKEQAEQRIIRTTYEFRPEIEANRQSDKEDLERIAFAFAERFGSYSNQANYGNIIDLKIFMTKDMQVWSDNLVKELKKEEEYTGEYYGITTKSLTSETVVYNQNSAIFLINTRRRESFNSMDNFKVFDQEIVISLKKDNNEWKVSSAIWK